MDVVESRHTVIENPGGGAAWIKSGVASLHTIQCGMGVLKVQNCVDVCGCKVGVRRTHFHTIWPYLINTLMFHVIIKNLQKIL